MADGISVDASELRRLAADFGRAAYSISRIAQQVVRKVAAGIEADAKILAPVDTGALRNSIGSDITGDGLTSVIGPTVHYAPYVELGTSRMAPQPFMGPAADKWAPIFAAAVEKLGGQILDG